MKYWLFKSEENEYPITQLKKDKTEFWDGVRNYQARNFMWKEMEKGDRALFYHSNAKIPGIVGVAEVYKEAAPDPTQFIKKSKYYDPKSSTEKPRWYAVELKYRKTFQEKISLETLKTMSALKESRLLMKGNRLSVMPIQKAEFKAILKKAGLSATELKKELG